MKMLVVLYTCWQINCIFFISDCAVVNLLEDVVSCSQFAGHSSWRQQSCSKSLLVTPTSCFLRCQIFREQEVRSIMQELSPCLTSNAMGCLFILTTKNFIHFKAISINISKKNYFVFRILLDKQNDSETLHTAKSEVHYKDQALFRVCALSRKIVIWTKQCNLILWMQSHCERGTLETGYMQTREISTNVTFLSLFSKLTTQSELSIDHSCSPGWVYYFVI